MLGPSATQEDIANLREQLGLNRPLYVQYGAFLGNALRGDLGRSMRSNAPVVEEIMDRLMVTKIPMEILLVEKWEDPK